MEMIDIFYSTIDLNKDTIKIKMRYLDFSDTFIKDIQALFDNNVYIDTVRNSLNNISRNLSINQSNILLLSTDHWGDDEFLLTDTNLRPVSIIDLAKNFANHYPDKKVFFITTCPFLHRHFSNCANISVVFIGDEFLFHPRTDYSGISPLREKKFDTAWHWISLSYNLRFHRNICNMILLGLEIPGGYIKFDPKLIDIHESWESFKYFLKFNKYHYLDSVSESVLQNGFKKIKNLSGYITHEYLGGIPEPISGNNLKENFESYLKKYFFSNTTVEIILETVFINDTGLITEKYVNSVYGYNFPIIIGMQKSVQHLRSLGLDVFDDIINHEYDNISDPYIRMYRAINDNIEILKNRNLSIDLWNKNLNRFDNNVTVMEFLYKNKENIAKQKIIEAIEKTH